MRLTFVRLCSAVVLSAAVASGSALAQPADDTAPATDPASPDPATPPETTTAAAAPVDPNAIKYGIGLRLRNVRIPKAELELFLDRAAGGASNVGLGLELIRRRGNVELQLGFEYEKVTVGNGVWIRSGDRVDQGAEADYVLSPDQSGQSLGWFTFEFTFLNHTPVHDKVSIRYGVGAGLGIITGELRRYDVICVGATNEMPEPGCVPPRFGGNGQYGGDTPGQDITRKYDLPPVFPVLNAFLGVQFKPHDKVTVNVEGGLRTLLFFGTSVAYWF